MYQMRSWKKWKGLCCWAWSIIGAWGSRTESPRIHWGERAFYLLKGDKGGMRNSKHEGCNSKETESAGSLWSEVTVVRRSRDGLCPRLVRPHDASWGFRTSFLEGSERQKQENEKISKNCPCFAYRTISICSSPAKRAHNGQVQVPILLRQHLP